ncbi:type IV secretion system protein VirB6 [Epibacterium ulvae]|uniref:Type IV secretion system protein VirB6 n=1 Tax=Epibacterium ulvae TaxID=1156985 RepID=A0A1G5RJS9_9RHOB|nr:type IV secretion system protein [Epibacterium ulvae]SCZ73509.1 type IV secretion system protein VirB6 [Epibacterium ulvae]
MIQQLYDSLIGAFTQQTDAIAANMSGALAAPLTAAMLLYLILYGIAIMKGAIQEPILDFAIRGIKLAIIWNLVTSAGEYTQWVSSTINQGIPEFVNSITGGSGTVPGDSVMRQADIFASAAAERHAAEGWTGALIGEVVYYFIMGYALLFAGISLAASLATTFFLSLMAAVGPLFICFALFDTTRGWFFAWLGQILNFALVKLLVIVLAVVMVGLIANIAAQTNGVDATGAYFVFLIGLTCGVIFFLLIPSVAAGLSAGAQASTGMLQRAVERSLGKPPSGGGGNPGGSATRR